MSIKHLIAEVQQRPSLWNNKDAEFYNRPYNDKLWDVVADIVQLPKASAKTKWKNLKDSFVKAVKGVGRRSDGSGSAVDPNKWPHFNSLLFLMECVTVSPEHLQNLPPDCVPLEHFQNLQQDLELPSNGTGEAEEQPGENSTAEQDGLGHDIPLDVQLRSGSRSRNKRRLQDPDSAASPKKTSKSASSDLEIQNITSFSSDLFKSDNRMIEILQEPDDDYDMHFLKSLVPFFKDMTSVQKLRVRSRLLNVIAEELSSQNYKK
ncbi:uncharacterized protein LOC124357697 [Homalodisca vitripennis]|uniref:uncharacterized protein LOC124357697 n=1 Tax=Homalodisca vitripennis TaxID=197043 RepID=UPI001EEBD0C1|nr:uncharacterized protein LOC124357697 [Homalodisca vitripennis]